MGFQTDQNENITAVPPEHPVDEQSVIDSVREILSGPEEEETASVYGERLAAMLARRMAAAEKENNQTANRNIIDRLFACREPDRTPDGRVCTTIIPIEQIDKYFS
jgi:DNA mismatch repair ATPase MutL